MKEYVIYKVRQPIGAVLLETCFKEIDCFPFETYENAEKFLTDTILKGKDEFDGSRYIILTVYS